MVYLPFQRTPVSREKPRANLPCICCFTPSSYSKITSPSIQRDGGKRDKGKKTPPSFFPARRGKTPLFPPVFPREGMGKKGRETGGKQGKRGEHTMGKTGGRAALPPSHPRPRGEGKGRRVHPVQEQSLSGRPQVLCPPASYRKSAPLPKREGARALLGDVKRPA